MVGALPADVSRLVDHVAVETVDRVSLVLRDGRTVVWGSADESALKARVTEVLLRQPAKTYDVAFPASRPPPASPDPAPARCRPCRTRYRPGVGSMQPDHRKSGHIATRLRVVPGLPAAACPVSSPRRG